MLADYTLCSNLSLRLRSLTEIVERFMPRLDRLGDNPKCIPVRHHYVMALLRSARYREAERVQTKLSAMAAKLNDVRSKAYALASAIQVSTIIAPNPVEIFEALSREAITAASNIDDAYLQCFIRYFVGWEEIHRGRMAKAHEAAEELMAVGRRMSDPRSIGFGLQLEAWAALVSDDYVAALDFAETGISVARTPIDRVNAMNANALRWFCSGDRMLSRCFAIECINARSAVGATRWLAVTESGASLWFCTERLAGEFVGWSNPFRDARARVILGSRRLVST